MCGRQGISHEARFCIMRVCVHMSCGTVPKQQVHTRMLPGAFVNYSHTVETYTQPGARIDWNAAPISPPVIVPKIRSTPLLSVVSTFSDSTTATVVIAYSSRHSRACRNDRGVVIGTYAQCPVTIYSDS